MRHNIFIGLICILSINFDVDQYKKTCLINGYDDIDFLVSKKEKINNFISLKC